MWPKFPDRHWSRVYHRWHPSINHRPYRRHQYLHYITYRLLCDSIQWSKQTKIKNNLSTNFFSVFVINRHDWFVEITTHILDGKRKKKIHSAKNDNVGGKMRFFVTVLTVIFSSDSSHSSYHDFSAMLHTDCSSSPSSSVEFMCFDIVCKFAYKCVRLNWMYYGFFSVSDWLLFRLHSFQAGRCVSFSPMCNTVRPIDGNSTFFSHYTNT